LSIREHGKGDTGAMDVQEFARKISAEVEQVFA
jgi:hypothetical protein